LRLILHVDLDAFYASVEELDNPGWAGHPLVVGADPQEGHGRGVVATANYAARAFGIRSAMPISEAWRRCPTARYVFPRFARYQEKSDEVFELLHEAADAVEGASIDEAYLDLTSRASTFDDAVRLAGDLQARIRDRTGLSASIGVASGKVVAKIASDFRKPGGLTPVAPGTEAAFLAPLPARRIPGIGPKTEARLAEAGIATVADVAALPSQRLADLFGSWGPRLGQLARGIDDSPVVTGWERKSLGSETTFMRDVDDEATLERTLRELASDLAASLAKETRRAKTITLKVRLTGFETYTRARTLAQPVADAPTLARHALDLLRANPPARAVRLLGLRATGLAEATQGAQATLAQWPATVHGEEVEETRKRATLRDWPADVLGESPGWTPPQRRLDGWR
jgi:nucleotidyltransferase/DNA polymerase involved in DNA repair